MNGGTYGYTLLGYNGVLFGEGTRCALASFAQMHVLDLAAASSAGPTATRYWTTTASSSAEGRSVPWLSSLRCGCWTWQRLHRPFQRRDLRPHGAGLLRRPLRQRGAQCPGLLRTGACAGLGSGFIGRFSDGTYGYTVLAYNGALFGEGARRALASLAQMQVLDPAAASSAASTAGPTATRCWTTTASTSAKGHAVPWPPSHRCRCWTSQRLHRPLQRRDLRKRGAGLQRRPLRRRGAPCHGLLRTLGGTLYELGVGGPLLDLGILDSALLLGILGGTLYEHGIGGSLYELGILNSALFLGTMGGTLYELGIGGTLYEHGIPNSGLFFGILGGSTYKLGIDGTLYELGILNSALLLGILGGTSYELGIGGTPYELGFLNSALFPGILADTLHELGFLNSGFLNSALLLGILGGIVGDRSRLRKRHEAEAATAAAAAAAASLVQGWAATCCLRGGALHERSHSGASAACGSARRRTPARRRVAAAARPVATLTSHATAAAQARTLLAPLRIHRPCRSFRVCRRLPRRRRRRCHRRMELQRLALRDQLRTRTPRQGLFSRRRLYAVHSARASRCVGHHGASSLT